MNNRYPNISDSQIIELKANLKLIARNIAALHGKQSRYRVTDVQNEAVRAKTGFTSLSHMSKDKHKEKPAIKDFDFWAWFDLPTCVKTFRNLEFAQSAGAQATGSEIASGYENAKNIWDSRNKKDLTFMGTKELFHVINGSQLTEHHYDNLSEFPTRFRVTKAEFGGALSHTDSFKIMNDLGEVKTYTVTDEHAHIYDKNLKCLEMHLGLWVMVGGGQLMRVS